MGKTRDMVYDLEGKLRMSKACIGELRDENATLRSQLATTKKELEELKKLLVDDLK